MTEPVRASAEITIDAEPQAVWRVLTDLAQWPDWNPGVTRVNVDGPVAVGTTFRWKTGPATIASTITTADAPSSIVWTGRTIGISAVHTWHFDEVQPGRTNVRSDETWVGMLPRLVPGRARRMLQNALTQGVEALKERVERGG